MGDFNCVLKTEERSSGRGVSEIFASWVSLKGLIDLGFSGQKFTWSHGRSVENRRAARLGRGLCDTEWRRRFPMASVKHLTHSYSDHCPILLQLNPGFGEKLGPMPFRFKAMWLTHREFPRWLCAHWNGGNNLTEALSELKFKLQEWNKRTFGNVFQRKKRNTLRLDSVRRALEAKVTEAMLKLEQKLRQKDKICSSRKNSSGYKNQESIG